MNSKESILSLTSNNDIVKYLNVRKDPIDLRDRMFQSYLFSNEEDLPTQVDLRERMSDVVDQGQLGSCTANAIVSGLREYLLKQSGRPFVLLSRLYLYYHERKIEGDIQNDNGAILRDGMSVLEKLGVCPEKDYPYQIEHFRDTPSSKSENDALLYRIGQYSRVQDLPRLKSALAHGLPVVLGFLVTNAFYHSDEVRKTGIVPISGTDDVIIEDGQPAGHAVCAVGYNDDKKVVIIRNSWGTEWGDEGYCYFPYELFQNGIVQDMWTGR
ncbi:C1 family peptidase [Bacillus pseudomycoides]|uniref:C1 family peptidase n=1 Tax=Bacillus pseudomycoides TaxID=64104 RepID=UPI000BEBE3F2|nr:C1 family peptidase [Bacillus pseudomycoides]MED4652714.1 C1 family peptidase [Bacillus pseudomycoides]PEE04230.1 peptidase C1 [Bacillus pseudomycoides]PEF73749.1 peptidase C1 [Bacillus pseudomycoides]PEL87644.1 peptidase C1 [Bacillus pseudomycoides]PEM66007.1 peptidase C1 [Bacillus pseudomycoides]